MFAKALFVAAASAMLVLPAAALAADAGGQIANAGTHAQLAAGAANLAGVHMHLHHAVNCLVGSKGVGYDANSMNPCANVGNGAIPDAADAARKHELEAALAKANAGLASNDIAVAKKDAADAAAALKAIK